MNKIYSSFSQMKGLLWREWYDGILKNDFLPPVGAVLDLTNACNLNCYWCNAQSYRSREMLELDHIKNVIDLISDWGVKSECFAGGGEPTLHPHFKEIIDYTSKSGLEIGISTNGVQLNRDISEAIANKARFCGISIDAGVKETWIKIKKSTEEYWKKLLRNCEELGLKAKNTPLDYTFKFMIVPDNQYEIYQACVLAKRLGFKNFFVRPASWENVPAISDLNMHFNTIMIQRQLERCEGEEDEFFKVYFSFGRVDSNFKRNLRFKKCRATPLMVVMCADGYCYPCIDLRGRREYRMCKHLDIKKYWNSEEHHKLIENIDISHCPRCAMGHYNEQIEAYACDYMFWKFP